VQTVIAAIKAGFEDLKEQLNKHKELLRKQHQCHAVAVAEAWLARSPSKTPWRRLTGTNFFGDISQYVNVNLPRLKRFIQRELTHREEEGILSSARSKWRMWSAKPSPTLSASRPANPSA